MIETVLPWILATLGVGAAIALTLRGRARAAAEAALTADLEAARAESGELRKHLARRTDKDARRDAELATLRKKVDKAKKRAAHARGEQQAEPGRVQVLDEELSLERSNASALRDELARAQSEVERLKEVAAREASSTPDTPTPEPVAADSRDAQIEALTGRVEAAEKALKRKADQLAKTDHDLQRMRKRVRNQDMLYTSIRSELDAKKDRLRTQQEELERLRALEVVLAPPPTQAADVATSEIDEAASAEVSTADVSSAEAASAEVSTADVSSAEETTADVAAVSEVEASSVEVAVAEKPADS